MKLRTFTAKDMPSAMKQIRAEMGEDAVILATTPERSGKGVRVTAAIEHSAEKTTFAEFKDTIDIAKRRTEHLSMQAQMKALCEAHRLPKATMNNLLRTSETLDVDALLTLQKLAAASSKQTIASQVLAQVLAKHYHFSPLPMQESGRRFMVIGPHGAGKTLTVAKCATQLVMSGKTPTIITLDYKSAGGVAALEAFTHILNVPLVVAHSPEEFVRALKAAPLTHTVLVDTPGINPMSSEDASTLAHYTKTTAIETVAVLSATMDADDAALAAQRMMHFSPKRLMITHTDYTLRMGALLAAADAAGLALSHTSASPRVVDALTPITPQPLAEQMFRAME